VSFIDASERLILMDMQLDYANPEIPRLPEDNIQMLVDAGIRTAMIFTVYWGFIEPQKGVYNWDYYGDRIRLLNRCGMKVLLQCYNKHPGWIPDSWKAKRIDNILTAISPWNEEAQEYTLDFYRKMVKHYNSKSCIVVNSREQDGETLMPQHGLACYDDHALADYKNKYGGEPSPHNPETEEWLKSTIVEQHIKTQEILSVCGEVWTLLHPALAFHYGCGCAWIDDVLNAYRTRMPDAEINHIYCTWNYDHIAPYYTQMEDWRDQYNENLYVGAEYATGVIDTTRKAIEHGIKGLLINPVHPYTGYTRIEPWMTDNIKKALELWP